MRTVRVCFALLGCLSSLGCVCGLIGLRVWVGGPAHAYVYVLITLELI
jgi:hypothetical protein